MADIEIVVQQILANVNALSQAQRNDPHDANYAVAEPILQASPTFLNDRGGWDASGSLFPETGGSGPGGNVAKADLWFITVPGTLGGTAVAIGDTINALADTPGQDADLWGITTAPAYIPVPSSREINGHALVQNIDLQLASDFEYVPENTANKSTSTSLGTSDTLYPTQNAVKTYADGLVTGLLDDRGGWDASGNVWPSTGGSGTDGAVLKGDLWFISVAGTLGGVPVNVGDSIRALTDTPGQTAANWNALEGNIGYVPENQTNKSTDGTFAANSDTLYPSQKAAKTYSDGITQTKIAAATDTDPVDGSFFALVTSVGVLIKSSGTRLKAYLKAYFDTLYTGTATVSPGQNGIELANYSGSNVKITLSAGRVSAEDYSSLHTLASSLSKDFNAAWAVGNNSGGLLGPSTSLAVSTTYHVYTIRRSDTGVVDAGALKSTETFAYPSGYDSRRYRGSFMTDASAQIIPFVQDGDRFALLTRVSQNAALSNTKTTVTLEVPLGVVVTAFGDVYTGLRNAADDVDVYIGVFDNSAADVTVSSSNANVHGIREATDARHRNVGWWEALTNTSGQVWWKSSVSNAWSDNPKINLYGWYVQRWTV